MYTVLNWRHHEVYKLITLILIQHQIINSICLLYTMHSYLYKDLATKMFGIIMEKVRTLIYLLMNNSNTNCILKIISVLISVSFKRSFIFIWQLMITFSGNNKIQKIVIVISNHKSHIYVYSHKGTWQYFLFNIMYSWRHFYAKNKFNLIYCYNRY